MQRTRKKINLKKEIKDYEKILNEGLYAEWIGLSKGEYNQQYFFARETEENIKEFFETGEAHNITTLLYYSVRLYNTYATFFAYDPVYEQEHGAACACTARMMYHQVMLGDRYNYMFENTPMLHWPRVGYYLSYITLLGWHNKARDIAEVYGRSLHGFYNPDPAVPRGITRGGDEPLSSWFILEMASHHWPLALDRQWMLYPKDFGPYQPVLDEWDSSDLKRVDQLVSQLCDTHLEEGYDYESERNGEFVGQNYGIFPYEILFWLEIRKLRGIANPADFTHPLMSAPQSKVPKVEWPKMPVYDDIFAKLVKAWPNELGESMARQQRPVV